MIIIFQLLYNIILFPVFMILSLVGLLFDRKIRQGFLGRIEIH